MDVDFGYRWTKFGFMPCVAGLNASATYIRRFFSASGSGGEFFLVQYVPYFAVILSSTSWMRETLGQSACRNLAS